MISSIKKTMLVDNKVDAFSVMEDMVDLAFLTTFKPYFRQSESDIDFVNGFDKRLHKLICSDDWDTKSTHAKIHYIKALMVKYMRNF